VLLDVLPVVALVAGQPEETLLENGVALVPQREREAEAGVVVTDAGQAVLAPAICAGAGMVVGEILPGGPIRAIVFADGSPLALAQVRPPPPPVSGPLLGFLEPPLLSPHSGTAIPPPLAGAAQLIESAATTGPESTARPAPLTP